MMLYGLEHLRNAGIKEVGIILGPISEGVVETLGDGSSLGLRITYIEQPEPKGLAHAVLISESFLGKEPFVMYLGDNLLRQGVSDFATSFEQKGLDCLVGVCPVKDPSRFGIAELDSRGNLTKLVEKPKEPKSNLALIGVYVFDPSIFEAVSKIRPSWRDELEITDAIQWMLEHGRKVEAMKVTSWWKDTGKPEDLLEANQLVLSDLQTSVEGVVSSETIVTGPLKFGTNSRSLGEVNIRGPAVIGSNCTIGPNVYIGPYTSIGDECTISNVEIENSIVMKGCKLDGNRHRIVDSLIGSYSTILNADSALPKGFKLVIGERSFAKL
jgi:glucose-1-phosphate thymidylyltransferase